MDTIRFPRLSSPHTEIDSIYDVIVIGSGYGGSIAASRCARAGQKVCLLERGREWIPGEFPETLMEASKHIQITKQGKKDIIGDPTDLYEFNVSEDISVVQGCGLGGGSLINANVGLDCDPRVFDLPSWPKIIKSDMKNIMTIDKQHVIDMLRPTPYPDHYPPLAKAKAMKKAAKELYQSAIADMEDLDRIVKKTPLYVNFDGSKANHVGIHQPACNGCGNCCGGCNTGAKNTLNMNYIPDAVAHGAHVFTEIEVSAVLRDPYSSLWRVHYNRKIPNKGFDINTQYIRAKYVILGAGALGSTRILLKSKQQGLDLSAQVGHHFSGNGDVVGFCYDADKELNGIGTETCLYDKVHSWSPGPTITTAIDLRSLEGQNVEQGMIIEDGTAPSVVKVPYSVTMAVANKLIGAKPPSNAKSWDKLYKKIKRQAMDRTLAFLVMSHDNSQGQICLDKVRDGVYIKWDNVGRQRNFVNVNKQIEDVSHKIGGTFIRNPMWSESFGKDVISAHPLGGCPMGSNGHEGVVNHKGQVFVGDSNDVYPGLYVIDGSILPTSVGVNPTMTISALAERCCRLLAEDAGWKLDYRLHKHLDESNFTKRAPGIRFTEKMVGHVQSVGADDKRDALIPCEFTVTIESQDLDKMIHNDPLHSAELTGTVTCSALSKHPLQISKGKFQLFKNSEDIVDAKEMVYKMTLTSEEDNQFYFEGIKIIKNDKFGEVGLEDTTTLFVKIFEKEHRNNEQYNGILKIHFADFMKQLQTIEILNVQSELEEIKWKTKFSSFFAKSLWETYSGLSNSNLFDPTAPPRKMRPLNIGNIVPEVYIITTDDKVKLKLTRYNGGSKGPLLVSPGMASSTSVFTLDTVPENFVEFFTRHHYDVWLFGWRCSTDIPSANSGQYTADDVGKYDFPAAVDKVLEVTGEKKVQVLAHCVSSIGLFASLLAGHLEGKVRSVLTSQVSATPIGSTYNKIKSSFHVPGFLENVGHVKAVTAYTDKNDGIGDKAFNSLCKLVADVITKSDEKCSSHVCHRLTAVYGLLFEHENLNVQTHDILHELFGSGSSSYFVHLARLFRKHKLVTAKGKDIYLPGMESRNRLQNSEYKKAIDRLNIPICFFHGPKSCVFDAESQKRTYDLVKEAHPRQQYELLSIEGYGHFDGFIGKSASRDVFPKLLDFLDKYAEHGMALNKNAITKVHRALDKLKFMTSAKRALAQTRLNKASNGVLSPKRAQVHSTNSVDIELDEPDSPSILDDLRDAPSSMLPELVAHLDVVFPNDRKQKWEKKSNSQSCFHKEPTYIAPKGERDDDVIVRRFRFDDYSEKREIFVISDLHLGGEWSRNIGPKIQDLCTTLAKIAEYYCHTIVLLGDIFDMWQTPITVPQPSNHDYVNDWKKDRTIQHFTRAIQKMAEDDDVNVFFVRGNHDNEITEEDVVKLLGNKVHFIPNKLIYVIDNGFMEYRIRFEHGHDYDLFNSYSVIPQDSPTKCKPFGYYITRAATTSLQKYLNETEKVLQNVLEHLLSAIPSAFLGSALIDLLTKSGLSKKVNESLIERALDEDVDGEVFVSNEGKQRTRLLDVIDFPYVDKISEQLGSTRTFGMLKASLGNWNYFLKEFQEDVVVLGHSHIWENKVLTGKHNNMHYVNCGSFIDVEDVFSYVKLTPPKKHADGQLEVYYAKNDLRSSGSSHQLGKLEE